MDDIVLRAMQKWPNVPQVFGWLRLDRRGQWLVKTVTGTFDRVTNAGFVDFISRNYDCDEQGRWFFQNGPQRVFVTLEYTPWVYRLSDSSDRLVTHTGREAGRISELDVDEAGALLAVAEPGIGVIDDRDLTAFGELRCGGVALIDCVESLVQSGAGAADIELFGQRLQLNAVQARELPPRHRYEPRPVPAEGQPDC